MHDHVTVRANATGPHPCTGKLKKTRGDVKDAGRRAAKKVASVEWSTEDFMISKGGGWGVASKRGGEVSTMEQGRSPPSVALSGRHTDNKSAYARGDGSFVVLKKAGWQAARETMSGLLEKVDRNEQGKGGGS